MCCLSIKKANDKKPISDFTQARIILGMHSRRHHPITVQQASQEAPELAQLLRQTQESKQRLRAIDGLLPPGLKPHIQAGPIEGNTWCLLVKSNTAANKLRHLLPALAAHLRTKGWVVQDIRLRVLPQTQATPGVTILNKKL